MHYRMIIMVFEKVVQLQLILWSSWLTLLTQSNSLAKSMQFVSIFGKRSNRHRYIIQKQKEMRLHWIEPYLVNRVQCLKVLGWKSYGLSQGSHLGPLLFILFFNSAAKSFRSAKLGVFPDDLNMYLNLNSMDDALNLHSFNLNSFPAWCKRNDKSLNIEKCKMMSFYCNTKATVYNYIIDNNVLEYENTAIL